MIPIGRLIPPADGERDVRFRGDPVAAIDDTTTGKFVLLTESLSVYLLHLDTDRRTLLRWAADAPNVWDGDGHSAELVEIIGTIRRGEYPFIRIRFGPLAPLGSARPTRVIALHHLVPDDLKEK